MYRGIDVKVIDIPSRQNGDAQIKEYVSAATLYLREHESEFDKIILDSWYVMMAGAIAQVIHLPKTFHLVQRDPLFEPENDTKIWTAYALELAGLFMMQRIVVGRSLADTFKERYGVDYSVLDIYIDDEYRKKDFTVQDRSPIKFIASAADFNKPWKGLDFLLESLSQFSGRQFELTLVTSTPIDRDLSGFPFPITIKKAYSPLEMRDILLQHDIYICASTAESFCLALAEAVTLGMPAIALDSIGNRDYARGDNFYFIEDTEQFLSKLNVICRIENRMKLHEVARDSMTKYSTEQMVEQFIKTATL